MFTQTKNDPIENKLVAARTKLILEKPFLGALVLRLPMKKARGAWCKTTATDAKHFYYNAGYINQLKPEEIQFVLAHEAMHCALSHFARRQHRIKMTWDVACDYAINPLLAKEGMTLVPGSLMMLEYDGMTAEEIYPMLDINEDQDTLDQHVYDKNEHEEGGTNSHTGDKDEPDDSDGKGQQKETPKHADKNQENSGTSNQQSDPDNEGVAAPPPLTAQEVQDLNVQWGQRLAGAAQQALQAGKMGANMARIVDFMLQPKLPWRMLLARFLNDIAREDYSYARPTSRRGDPAIFPSLRSSEVNIGVAIDTSGSISTKEMSEFVSEIDAIKGVMRAKITLHTCDRQLAKDGPWVFESWDEFRVPKSIKGGGGTDFCPIFTWLDSMDRQPNILVYFTDADGPFPKVEPTIAVIWLVKGRKPVPFGQRVQLN